MLFPVRVSDNTRCANQAFGNLLDLIKRIILSSFIVRFTTAVKDIYCR